MKKRENRWGERGNFVLLAAFCLALLLGFGALVLDVGILYWNHQQEQNIAEAAALAAVKELDSTPAGLSAARATAALLVAANDPADVFAFRSESEVEFGIWDGTSFTVSNEPLVINAVRVHVTRTREKGNAVPPVLAGVFSFFDAGHDITGGISVRNSAVAVLDSSSGSAVDCGLAAGNQLTMSGNVSLKGNGCSNGSVSVSGSVDVDGDLSCGPGSHITMSGSVSISGSTECRGEALSIPPFDISPFRNHNDNHRAICSQGNCISNNNLNLSGPRSVTLPAGTYYFNNISISGSAHITVIGEVTIYVEGNMSVAGQGIINTLQNPDDLHIFVDGGQVSLSGRSDFYGHVYAPNSSVSLSGTADYHGSLTGGVVSVSGTVDFFMGGGVPVGAGSSNQRSYLVQ